MKLFTPLIILALAIVIIALSCQNDSPEQEDLALEAAREFFRVTDVTVEDSKRMYLHYCSVCHGATGKGDGFNAYNLDPKPRDFTDSTFLNKADSAYVVKVITDGGRAVDLSAMMPPYGRTLTTTEIEKLAEYVLFLSRDSTN
ncbi:MAG: cytochrome c [candidate division Zixibacteria bacterium]|nr:cytochrome c [candidate division Zixibacteria bacterium]